MEKQKYHMSMAGIEREIAFPYQVAAIGLSPDNPASRDLRSAYPDKIEICIRLSSDLQKDPPVQIIEGRRYENLVYPHVVVKPPRAEYTLMNFGRRDVFYIIYNSALLPRLRETGILEEPLCWNIRITNDLEQMIERINTFSGDTLIPGRADQIDIQCFQILHELMLMKKNSQTPHDKEHELMLKIDSCIRRHAFELIDFNDIARQFGLSRSSFFRYWKRYSDTTPAEYLQELRLQEAARRLTETRTRIGVIAKELKLGEPAYMGMLFRKRFGQTPLEYRKNHAPNIR